MRPKGPVQQPVGIVAVVQGEVRGQVRDSQQDQAHVDFHLWRTLKGPCQFCRVEPTVSKAPPLAETGWRLWQTGKISLPA